MSKIARSAQFDPLLAVALPLDGDGGRPAGGLDKAEFTDTQGLGSFDAGAGDVSPISLRQASLDEHFAQRARSEHARLRRDQLALKRVERDACQWRRAQRLRDYLSALVVASEAVDPVWLKWAKQQAERIDPLTFPPSYSLRPDESDDTADEGRGDPPKAGPRR